jgi:hypothetical protein
VTQIRCYRCFCFFDKKLLSCPDCDSPRRGFNSYLQTAALNNNLYAVAEHADKERNLVKAMKSGREPDPPKWARQKAKEIVANW